MTDPLRILLVDDNANDRALVKRQLQQDYPQVEMVEVKDAQGFEASLAAGGFHLIITDFQLRWANGMQVLQAVKNRWPDFPVVMFTATGTEEVAVQAMKEGLDDYILKSPKHFIRLSAVIPQVLDKAQKTRALRDLQRRFQVMIEGSSDAILLLDAEGKVVYASPAASSLSGYAPEELLGPYDLSRVHPEDQTRILEFLREGFQRPGQELRGQCRLQRKDGCWRWVEGIATNRLDDPALRAMVLNFRDITERKLAELELANRVRQQAAMVELGQQALAGVDIIALQERAVALTAQTLEVELCKVLELQADGTLLLRAGVGWHQGLVWAAKVGAGRDSQAGYTLLCGEPVVVVEDLRRETRFRGPPLLHEHGVIGGLSTIIASRGRPYGILGAHTTRPRLFTAAEAQFLQAMAGVLAAAMDHARAEELLRASEQRYRHLVETAPDIIVTLAPEGTFTSINPAFEKLLAWPADQWLGRSFLDLVHPDDLERTRASLARILQGEIQAVAELRFLTRSGEVVPVEVLAATQLKDGRVAGVLAIVRNISERKRLETQFLQAQKMEAFGQLAGGVAHDFNNLLTIINGFSELALSQIGTDKATQGLLREINKAGERAATLTRQLLVFSRKQIIAPAALDLNTVVADMEKMLRRLIGEDIKLIAKMEPNLGRVLADPGQIEQVLLNLAVNARDAMPRGGHLTIETGNVELDQSYADKHLEVRPGPYVQLSVSDTGCGMDAQTMAHIFEPFFTTKEAGKGTGLGLATVFGCVKQNGGYIEAYSEVGRGTSFKIYLPRLDEARAASKLPAKAASARGGSETILLVEDDDMVRQIATITLEAKGYQVLTAANGAAAWQLSRQHQGTIHLLVTDVIMPEMDGRELADRLQAERPHMKVLFLSGYTDDAVSRYGVKSQEVAFLQKPLTLNSLALKVRAVLDGGG